MHRHVAADALAARLKSQASVRNTGLRVKPGVALQAELPAFAPHQQHAIGTAVRVVADHASFHLGRRVLEYIRPAFLDVALHASFRTRMVQAGDIFRAVRIVAVRTFQEPFGNAVVLGQSELRLNSLVADKTQRRLRLLQQAVVQPARFIGQLRHLKEVRLRRKQCAFAGVFHFIDQMGRVALAARQAVARVRGLGKVVLLLAGVVAGEAARGIFFGASLKRKNRMLDEGFGHFRIVAMRGLHGIAVRFSRAVAGFAAVNVVRAGEDDLGVRGFFIFDGFLLMAVAARGWSGKFARRRVKVRHAAGYGRAVQGFRALLREARNDRENEEGQSECNCARKSGLETERGGTRAG